MFTLSLLTSRSIRAFFETPDVSKGAPEIVNSGRRDVIRAGLGTLVLATAGSAMNTLANEIDKSKWEELFKKNYNNGNKTAAATERKSWSEEMKDAYDEWIDKRIAEGKTKVIKEEERLANANIASKMIDLAKNNSPATLSELQATLQKRPDLETNPIIGEFCRDILRNNCPPVQQKHIQATLKWIENLKQA